MQTSKSSREETLYNVRLFLPDEMVEQPQVPAFSRRQSRSLRSEFDLRLKEAGGAAHDISSVTEARSKVDALHPEAKVICSAAPEIPGTRNVHNVRDPHELADVDVGVVRAQFGIAESGAVWVTEEDLGVDALAFLSQHLIVLLEPGQIVSDMHEAYRRVQLNKTAFGCFMMGPSATADVEATLVHGAQGARSLNVLFLPPS